MLARSLLLALALAVAAAGCVKPTSDTIDPAIIDPSLLELLPLTEVIQGDILASAATPLRTLNYGGAFSTTVTVNGTHTGYVLDLVWEAANPASEKLSVWVREAGAGALPPTDPLSLLMPPEPIAILNGASPLHLALPVEAFPAEGEYEIVVRAASEPAGVAVEQEFTLHLTTFDAIPFDETFSALGAPSEG